VLCGTKLQESQMIWVESYRYYDNVLRASKDEGRSYRTDCFCRRIDFCDNIIVEGLEYDA
jgi:hypothetical protein